MTLAEFRVAHPEWAKTLDPTVEVALDAATDEVDTAVFGAKADRAIGLMACHILSTSPSGSAARLKGEGFGTLYLAEFQRLVDQVACGWVE